MPLRLQAYERPELHPVFQMNLPEGYLLERLKNLLAKTSGSDPMVLLALLGSGAPIGRIRFAAASPLAVAASSPGTGPLPGERLAGILAYRGAGGLFDSLVDRYLTRSALSGVQPKVLVPEASPQAPSKAAAFMRTSPGSSAPSVRRSTSRRRSRNSSTSWRCRASWATAMRT